MKIVSNARLNLLKITSPQLLRNKEPLVSINEYVAHVRISGAVRDTRSSSEFGQFFDITYRVNNYLNICCSGWLNVLGLADYSGDCHYTDIVSTSVTVVV